MVIARIRDNLQKIDLVFLLALVINLYLLFFFWNLHNANSLQLTTSWQWISNSKININPNHIFKFFLYRKEEKGDQYLFIPWFNFQIPDEIIIMLILGRRKLRLKSVTSYNLPNGYVWIWNNTFDPKLHFWLSDLYIYIRPLNFFFCKRPNGKYFRLCKATTQL